MDRPLRIGVLALQGAFREHATALRELGAEVTEVRLPDELDGLDGLVIPGGESTAILRLAGLYGLDEVIRAFRGPILGTCAGMILLDRDHLGVADLRVERNAYGRQVRSFEADVELSEDPVPLRGVFIRAPRIRSLGDEVEVLGELAGEPVLVRDGRLLLAAFHPELTDDRRVHERFLELVRKEQHSRPPVAPLAKEASARRTGQHDRYGHAPSAKHPAASSVGLGRSPALPGESARRPGGRDVRA
jgi:pyridoxal 5'-phosphate synthase pdxT subunit